MGFFKDLFGMGSGSKAGRAERSERVDIRGTDERQEVYDKDGHLVETRRWNRHTDRWDVLDRTGDVKGHIERNVRGEMVHKDRFERVTGKDVREDSRTTSHYDAAGNKTGYTTRGNFNDLTRHTYIDESEEEGNTLIGRLLSSCESSSSAGRAASGYQTAYAADADIEDDDSDDYDDDLEELDYDDPYEDEDDEEDDDSWLYDTDDEDDEDDDDIY